MLNLHVFQLHNIINQRESRLNLEIAIQQRKIAIIGARESITMRTLTMLGLVFLPGTFLSSLFGMPFFKFGHGESHQLFDRISPSVPGNDHTNRHIFLPTSKDVHGEVSRSLWIYLVATVPLTVVIVGAWWVYDRRISRIACDRRDIAADEGHTEKSEQEENLRSEACIMRNMRRRMGIKAADLGTLPRTPVGKPPTTTLESGRNLRNLPGLRRRVYRNQINVRQMHSETIRIYVVTYISIHYT